jgi:hypothetical protein
MDEKSTNLQRRPMSKPVEWTGYESLRSEHATHLVIQSHGSELTLLFFELQLPFTIGTPEEQAAHMEELPHIEAKCVAKIVMSVPNATQVSDVLSEQLKQFKLAAQEAMQAAKNSQIVHIT